MIDEDLVSKGSQRCCAVNTGEPSVASVGKIATSIVSNDNIATGWATSHLASPSCAIDRIEAHGHKYIEKKGNDDDPSAMDGVDAKRRARESVTIVFRAHGIKYPARSIFSLTYPAGAESAEHRDHRKRAFPKSQTWPRRGHPEGGAEIQGKGLNETSETKGVGEL